MTAVSQADIDAMPQIADATLANTLHWSETKEERLYRECPTAFWLAPDAEAVLRPADGPVLPPPPRPVDLVEDATTGWRAEGFGSAVGYAVAIAGPTFVATMGLIDTGVGTPIERIASGIALGAVSAPMSIPFGSIAAFVPVLLGAFILTHAGVEHSIARRRSLWAAVGTGMGLLIAAAFDAGMVTIPLLLTSIACASIAHRAITWVEPEPA